MALRAHGHRRSQTFGNSQCVLVGKPPVEGLTSPVVIRTLRQPSGPSKNLVDPQNRPSKSTFFDQNSKIGRKDFYVDGIVHNFEESTEHPPQRAQGRHRKTISISDSLLKGNRIINNSTSTSSHNTLPHDTHLFGTPEDDQKAHSRVIINKGRRSVCQSPTTNPIKVEATYQNKNLKTVSKLTDAKEKAKHYSDKIVRQYQFIQDDEDEEVNFQQLCKALES